MPTILGVRVDSVTREDALVKARSFLSSHGQQTIFTPNPEMVVDAQNDEYFRTVLNSGTLNICDGYGLALISHGAIKKIAGVDFLSDLCMLAAEEGRGVYLLGSLDDAVLEKTKYHLGKMFPTLRIVGMDRGPEIRNHSQDSHIIYNTVDNCRIIDAITHVAPTILFVAFGHGKQEKWIHENIKKMPSVKIAIGVGGAFDMISGKTPRAPRLLQRIGLEWLWRLVTDPRRIGRIWKATGKFLLLYVRERDTSAIQRKF